MSRGVQGRSHLVMPGGKRRNGWLGLGEAWKGPNNYILPNMGLEPMTLSERLLCSTN